MGRKKRTVNYLDMIPSRGSMDWHVGEDGRVTLEIENRGVFHTIAQKLFRKPRISYVHLDELGSFIWQRIDGVYTVGELAGPVKEQFGEAAEPLYPRIVKYFQIVESYRFVKFVNQFDSYPSPWGISAPCSWRYPAADYYGTADFLYSSLCCNTPNTGSQTFLNLYPCGHC